jgi:hypothetical protein
MRLSNLAVVCLLLGGALLVVYALTAGEDDSGAAPPPLRPSATSTVWAVGDGADGGRGAAVAQLIAEGRPARFIYLGDVYETGTPEEFARAYAPFFGRFDAFALPTPGNHEWPNRRDGYLPYWKKAGRPATNSSVRFAGWELISLNSEASPEEQLPWLRRQLRERGTCRLAFWHRPRYSAGQHEDATDLEPFWRALEGRATLILNGHDHNMQRWRLRRLNQLIAGAGGRELGEAADTRRRGLRFSNDTDYGALKLDLKPGLAVWNFVAVDGRSLDSGTVRCEPLRAAR